MNLNALLRLQEEDDEYTIMSELMASMGKTRGVDFYGSKSIEFFQPDDQFINWIVEYAAGRLMVDIGCGSGLTTMRIADAGGHICGIDPYFDLDIYAKMNKERIMAQKEMLQILPMKIQQCPELIRNKGNKILMLFFRPCHSTFVMEALDMKDPETEALYITKPENMFIYNDLGAHDDRAVKIEHRGWSVEHEEVYSIK
jgi:hypothetical protein